MTCADFEILLCDHVDGTLSESQRRDFETHQRECASCAELVRDVTGAVGFMQRAEEINAPQELLTKITFNIPRGGKQSRNWLTGWLKPLMQPRFVMGMAMTILSFSMLGRFTGIQVRQLQPSDLSPAKVWASLDDRAHRAWDRAVKYYENLRVVYEVQSRLQEWTQQEEEDRRANENVKTQPTLPESSKTSEGTPGK